MKHVTTILFLLVLLLLAAPDFAQSKTELTADESIPIPKTSFDDKGDLKITASATSSPNDFDFLVGKWNMHNRHLNELPAFARMNPMASGTLMGSRYGRADRTASYASATPTIRASRGMASPRSPWG